jgi:AcrR family transcriptional regulator
MKGVKAAEAGVAQRLPAGMHGLPAELVARNQRERLIAAMAETCAEKSYAELAVADVVRCAGVSTATFYKQFDGKRDCMLAAHAELGGRLLEEIDRVAASASSWEEGVRIVIRTALAILAVDAPTARLLTVEILAVGPEGSERHDAALEALAQRLRAGRDPRGDSPLAHADWCAVAAASALVGRVVMRGEAASLPGLEDELVGLVTAGSR